MNGWDTARRLRIEPFAVTEPRRNFVVNYWGITGSDQQIRA
jgi:hypothetical protein